MIEHHNHTHFNDDMSREEMLALLGYWSSGIGWMLLQG